MRLIIFLMIYFIAGYSLFAQNNLLPNPYFYNNLPGQYPRCNYDSRDVGSDMYDWKRAISSTGQYIKSSPDWMSGACFTAFSIPSDQRFIYLEKVPSGTDRHQDAIRTGLLQYLNPQKNYIFKITYTQVPFKNYSGTIYGDPRVRIWFTKYSESWSATAFFGNVKWSFLLYPPPMHSQVPGSWTQHWFIIPGPLIPYAAFLFSQTGNFVMDCEDGAMYIDHVELSELCESPLLLENHQFNEFPQELPYKSGGILKAGYDVGSPQPNGDVVVNEQANVIFKAATAIELLPGFSVKYYGNFETVIQSCSNYSPSRLSSSGNQVKGENLSQARIIDNSEFIETNTYYVFLDSLDRVDTLLIFDDSQQTLECGDTLQITGLDGDTSSFTFWWDFGNGQTSTDKIVQIIYDEPGEYLVRMAVTDSSNNSDTLSKLFIMPACDSRMAAHSVSGINKFKIQPNPSGGNFIVTIEEGSYKRYEIFDITGKKVIEKEISGGDNTLEISLNVRGIYFIRMITHQHLFEHEKIVIN